MKIITKYIKNDNILTGVNFSISSLFLNLIKLVTGVFIISWIEPSKIGLWNSIAVAGTYFPIFQLGILSGLNRELPFYYGKGQNDLIANLASTTLWFVLFIMSLATISTVTLFCVYIKSNYLLAISILILGLISTFNLYNTYLNVTFRANQSFKKLSIINYLLVGFYLITLLMPYFFSYNGYIFRLLLLAIISVFLIHINRPLRVLPKFHFPQFKLLIKSGLSLYSLGYLQEATTTFSRLVLLSIAGTSAVGFFSPSISIYGGMNMLGAALGLYIYPKMTYNYGKYNQPKLLWKWVWSSAMIIIISSIPIIIIGWILMPWIFEHIFPKYMTGLFAAKLALISGALESAVVGINVLNTLKAYKWLIILTCFKLVLFLGLIYYFGNTPNPINGVAMGLLISCIIYFVTSLSVCYFATSQRQYD